MKLSVKVTQLEKQAKTSLVIGIFEDGEFTASANELDKACHGYIKKLMKQGTFEAKQGQTLSLFHLTNTPFEHILLVGCG